MAEELEHIVESIPDNTCINILKYEGGYFFVSIKTLDGLRVRAVANGGDLNECFRELSDGIKNKEGYLDVGPLEKDRSNKVVKSRKRTSSVSLVRKKSKGRSRKERIEAVRRKYMNEGGNKGNGGIGNG